MKLLICDDKTLKSRRGSISANIALIKQYIAEGNRFLLTTKRSQYGLLDDELDDGWIAFVQPINPLRHFEVEYTDLSCLNGLYLYNGNGKLVHSYPLSHDFRERLQAIPKKKNLYVDITEYVPDYDTMDKEIVGEVKVTVSADYKEKYLRAKNYIRKAVKEAGQEINHTVSFDHYKGHTAVYKIRSAKASEDNQIKYITDRYKIPSNNVLDLRGEDPELLNKKIKEFSGIDKVRKKEKKRW